MGPPQAAWAVGSTVSAVTSPTNALQDFHELVSSTRAAEVRRYGTVVWVDASSSDPFLNAVSPRALELPVSSDDLDLAFRACSESLSAFMWWTSGTDHEERFKSDARFHNDGTVTLMELPAESYRHPEAEPGRSVDIMCGCDTTPEFFAAAARGFGDTDSDPDELAGVFCGLVENGRVVAFQAVSDGAIVGTALLHLSCEDTARAGVYWVAVVPELRGAGIATSLVSLAVKTALGHDRTLVVLQASPVSVRLYERLGFRSVGYLSSWLLPRHTGPRPWANSAD